MFTGTYRCTECLTEHDTFNAAARCHYGIGGVEEVGNEACRVCGQPDNCGDCDHVQLTPEQVEFLGGIPLTV